MRGLITIAELPEYRDRAAKVLTSEEYQEIIDYLAAFPRSGDLIKDTGGIRKLRWRRQGRGKSGGVRVIYYFHNERMPIYLLTVFAKSERANLSQRERNALARLVKILISTGLNS